MIEKSNILVFGEVLFDCFPSGENVLGGAPFNVAWHLQALGDKPDFISRVGADQPGQVILDAMTEWGMATNTVQKDTLHPTGMVKIEFQVSEPHYDITPDCAYDYIAPPILPQQGILYHGTLALRNNVSRSSLVAISRNPGVSIFLDVNLRSPWWQLDEVLEYIAHARWLKINEDELRQLGFTANSIKQAMADVQAQFPLEYLIVTRGEQGVCVLDKQGGFEVIIPEPIIDIVDTVGAGDAFSAMFIHGINSGWSITKILSEAQRFAATIIGQRGATVPERSFYANFIE